jgi:hypothetical protein
MSGSTIDSPSPDDADPQEVLIQQLEAAQSPYDGSEPEALALSWLGPYVQKIDYGISQSDLLRVVKATYKILGNQDGLELLVYWRGKGGNIDSRTEIEAIWCSLSSAPEDSNTIAAPSNMPAENGESGVAKNESKAAITVLDKFSLTGMSSELEKSVVAEVPILGQVALQGQLTAWYSAPNIGKTLFAISMLIDAIQQGRVDPSKVFYLNLDDNSNGLLEKLRIAEEFGFHMLAEGYMEFSATQFAAHVAEMTSTGQASGVIIILDTLKKVVDLMDKTKASRFTKVFRAFALKGGTVIALAHTNKKPGGDGKPIYGGVSDIVNDFDCAYTLAAIPADGDPTLKVVEFAQFKGRGKTVEYAAYSYVTGFGIPYLETLLSVQARDASEVRPLKQAQQLRSDAELIAAVGECICFGVTTKMVLAATVANRSGCSKRIALQVIEKYTGADPAIHRWNYTVQEHGAKVFSMLDTASQSTNSKGSSD